MKLLSIIISLIFNLFLPGRTSSDAEIVKVNSLVSLQQAINNAKPGDRIMVANGVYTTIESINISRQGTAEKPIVIEAESIGGVEISGTNGFQTNSPSSFIIIKGKHRVANQISAWMMIVMPHKNLFIFFFDN